MEILVPTQAKLIRNPDWVVDVGNRRFSDATARVAHVRSWSVRKHFVIVSKRRELNHLRNVPNLIRRQLSGQNAARPKCTNDRFDQIASATKNGIREKKPFAAFRVAKFA